MPFTFNPILTCHSRDRPNVPVYKGPAIRKCAHVLGRNFYRELISEFRNETLHCGRVNQRILPPGAAI